MGIRIALAGNPNCGKTTLFNALTGSNQYVGNWPGVTVEKKEGKLKKYENVTLTDLPGIYSLSPYTLEEVVARNYLINERPDAIINIIDGTNLERNLYLTTQLVELGIPVVIAINMIDIVRKNGDKIDLEELSNQVGCKVFEISALKKEGIFEVATYAVKLAEEKTVLPPRHTFSGPVEHVIAHIEEHALSSFPEERQRWYAIKLFERDEKVLDEMKFSKETQDDIQEHIKEAEKELDDDAESIITNQRYIFIASVIKSSYIRKNKAKSSTSDKIDKIVTNRIAALPIFAVIMFLVYFLAMAPKAIGTYFTDWANDGLFGDGWFAFSIGRKSYDEKQSQWNENDTIVSGFEVKALDLGRDVWNIENAEIEFIDEDTGLVSQTRDVSYAEYLQSKEWLENHDEPNPRDFGPWVDGLPVLIESGLDKLNTATWLKGLILDGIVAGVGAVLGFIPQMIILFILLAFLEGCGYMARIAFVMDRIFRKFGLSGKSFIPILVATGCGVPGIMATRTIENEKDRRITIMTTTFIPCSAKLPFIGLVAGSIFNSSPLVAVSAYFLGLASIAVSGIILKKTKQFAGQVAPFVMELPSYHLPTLSSIGHSVLDRTVHYLKKAGTIILLSTILIWFLSHFGFIQSHFTWLENEEINYSILAYFGKGVSWIFSPLGWGLYHWQATVATITGLIAKENIVATLGVLYDIAHGGLNQAFSGFSGYSFLAFNLLCAPCFAAMGTIKAEMKSNKWFWAAIGYECGFAYLISFIIYNIGKIFSGSFTAGFLSFTGSFLAILVLSGLIYLIVRKNKNDLVVKG